MTTWASPYYETFAARYEKDYPARYQKTNKDFVQLDRMRRAQPELTVEKWSQAVSNYFDTNMSDHTLAYLAAHYPTFLRGSLDSFGKRRQKPRDIPQTSAPVQDAQYEASLETARVLDLEQRRKNRERQIEQLTRDGWSVDRITGKVTR